MAEMGKWVNFERWNMMEAAVVAVNGKMAYDVVGVGVGVVGVVEIEIVMNGGRQRGLRWMTERVRQFESAIVLVVY